VETNSGRAVVAVEIKCGHRLLYIAPQLLPIVSLCEDRFCEALSYKAPVAILGNLENNLFHEPQLTGAQRPWQDSARPTLV
jgi:hypothetical protein